MCNCQQHSVLMDITQCYSSFTEEFLEVEIGDWVSLQKCQNCGQHWRVNAWDKLQTQYALKVSSVENWEAINMEPLIKEKMITNRGGLTSDSCMWFDCNSKQVKGSAFCVDHLYSGGSRE